MPPCQRPPLSISAATVASSAGSNAHCTIWRRLWSHGSKESGLMPILQGGRDSVLMWAAAVM